jgi:NAD(P)H-dependent FMN reductase
MTKPKIGIILSTTREGRFSDRPAQWLLDLAKTRDDATFEVVDLRDYPMPFFDAAASPRFMPVTDPVAHRWIDRLNGLDSFIFVTAEYNRSISGVLKNALDYVSDETTRKPAAFVGYGPVGAVRAIEQLRLMSVELGMVPTRVGVHITMEPFLGLLQQGKDFADYPHLAQSAQTMMDELVWYAATLKVGREQPVLSEAA